MNNIKTKSTNIEFLSVDSVIIYKIITSYYGISINEQCG